MPARAQEDNGVSPDQPTADPLAPDQQSPDQYPADDTGAARLPDWTWSWQPAVRKLLGGEFAWKSAGPVLAAPQSAWGIKDPAAVQVAGQWHIFCTVRGPQGYAIEHISLPSWPEADKAQRQVLDLDAADPRSPQVFHFDLHKKWYLLFQAADKAHPNQVRPMYSVNDDIANPKGWSKPAPLLDDIAPSKLWNDFRVICDDADACLFYTTLDGWMWRLHTNIEDFPRGWTGQTHALRGDFVRGPRIYAIHRLRRYLAILEAQDVGRRYGKAYVATSLRGDWYPLADSPRKPLVSRGNVAFSGLAWADSFACGEVLRSNCDQTMEIDPTQLRLLIAGCGADDRVAKGYGQVPWKLGVLEMDAGKK